MSNNNEELEQTIHAAHGGVQGGGEQSTKSDASGEDSDLDFLEEDPDSWEAEWEPDENLDLDDLSEEEDATPSPAQSNKQTSEDEDDASADEVDLESDPHEEDDSEADWVEIEEDEDDAEQRRKRWVKWGLVGATIVAASGFAFSSLIGGDDRSANPSAVDAGQQTPSTSKTALDPSELDVPAAQIDEKAIAEAVFKRFKEASDYQAQRLQKIEKIVKKHTDIQPGASMEEIENALSGIAHVTDTRRVSNEIESLQKDLDKTVQRMGNTLFNRQDRMMSRLDRVVSAAGQSGGPSHGQSDEVAFHRAIAQLRKDLEQQQEQMRKLLAQKAGPSQEERQKITDLKKRVESLRTERNQLQERFVTSAEDINLFPGYQIIGVSDQAIVLEHEEQPSLTHQVALGEDFYGTTIQQVSWEDRRVRIETNRGAMYYKPE